MINYISLYLPIILYFLLSFMLTFQKYFFGNEEILEINVCQISTFQLGLFKRIIHCKFFVFFYIDTQPYMDSRCKKQPNSRGQKPPIQLLRGQLPKIEIWCLRLTVILLPNRPAAFSNPKGLLMLRLQRSLSCIDDCRCG